MPRLPPLRTQTTPAEATARVTAGSGRRRLVAASAILALAALATGAVVSWRRSSVLDPARPPSGPVVSDVTSTAVAERASVPPARTASTTTAAIAPTTTARRAATPTVPVVRPRGQVAGKPILEPPAVSVSEAGRGAAATSSSEPAESRIRLSVEHPFENGRLIVWIDGVLVYETKPRRRCPRGSAPQGPRRPRRKLLDVEPGPPEMRVEVTWDQDRRVSTKVVESLWLDRPARGPCGPHEQGPEPLIWSRLAKE